MTIESLLAKHDRISERYPLDTDNRVVILESKAIAALLRELVAAREEVAVSRKKLVSDFGGFMVGGSLEDTLTLHNSRIATFAARLESDRAMNESTNPTPAPPASGAAAGE